MKKYFKLFLLIILFNIGIINVSAEDISITSNNAVFYDITNDKIIYEKAKDEKVYIASLTKIMTLIVSIENIDDYNKKILVTNDMLKNIYYDFSIVGFKAGEVITYDDLLYGTLLKSGADATNMLAINISGDVDSFVKLMNNKAKELNMNNSNFTNTIGIEIGEHYSSAYDLVKLLKYSLKNKKFKEVFTSTTYTSTNGLYEMKGPINKLHEMDMKYVKGAKTGYTSKAGLCLATYSKNKNYEYLLVTIGAPYDNKLNHMEDTKKIYEYYFNNYDYKEILSAGEVLVSVKTVYGKEYEIKQNENIKLYLNKKSDLKYKYKGETTLDKGINKNDKIGTYYVYNGDELLYKKDILSPYTVRFDLIFFIKKHILIISLLVIVILTIRIKNKKE